MLPLRHHRHLHVAARPADGLTCNNCRCYLGAHGQLPPLGLECAKCGGSAPGPYKTAAWRRDEELTGDAWYCSP